MAGIAKTAPDKILYMSVYSETALKNEVKNT